MISFFRTLQVKRLSSLFKKETIQYVAQVNAFREEGMRTKWREQPKTKDPVDTREKYASQIYDLVLKYNKDGKSDALRNLFPPQTEIFYELTEHKETASHIEKIVCIKEDLFLVRMTTPQFSPEHTLSSFQGVCYLYQENRFTKLDGVKDFGVCPRKQIYAYVKSDAIELKNGWDGDILRTIALPQSVTLSFPDGSIAQDRFELSHKMADLCIPFCDGKRILLGHEEHGVLLVDEERYTVLLPTQQDILDDQEAARAFGDEEDDDEDPFVSQGALDMGDYPMLHLALSHNNASIALGHQCSRHRLYGCAGALLGESEPASSYPHYALFSKDDKQVMFNACHFYNGATIALNVADMASGDAVSQDKAIELDAESRVYAGVSTSFGYIIGDAQGYIRARGHDGAYLWDDYLGFNIKAMDITDDEKFLYVGTYKGIIYKIQLNTGKRCPYQIGNSTNIEVARWMFWEKDTILRW